MIGRKVILAIVLLAATLAVGCDKNEIEIENGISFSGTLQATETRTFLAGTAADGSFIQSWIGTEAPFAFNATRYTTATASSNAISLKQTNITYHPSTTSFVGNSTFKADAGDILFSVYSTSSSNGYVSINNSGSVSLVDNMVRFASNSNDSQLRSEQKYFFNNISDADALAFSNNNFINSSSMIKVAYTVYNGSGHVDFAYKNAVSVIRIPVKVTSGSATVTSATLTANGNQKIAGRFVVEMSSPNDFTITPASNAVSTITMTPGNTTSSKIEIGETTKYICFCVFPQVYTNGIKFEIQTDKGNITKTSTTAVDVSTIAVYNFPEVVISAE